MVLDLEIKASWLLSRTGHVAHALCACTENLFKKLSLDSEPSVSENWAWVGGTIDMLNFTFFI